MAYGYTVGDILAGPFDVYLGSNILGHTEEGCRVTLAQSMVPVLSDLYGDAPIDAIHRPGQAVVEIRSLQFANAQLLDYLIGSSETTGPTTKAVQWGSVAGTLASSIAADLRLHRSQNGASDHSEDLTIYQAYPISDLTFALTSRSPAGIDVVFGGLVDTANSAGNLLGQFREDAA